jgi:hypothetical protein
MPLRSWIKRIEKAAKGNLESFELLDGSRYYFDPLSWELFLHWCDCLRAGSAHNWPEPPAVVRKLTEAKDVERAIEKVRGDGRSCLVYDEEILNSERRLQARGLVTSRDPDTGEWVIRDPYEDRAEDLSE